MVRTAALLALVVSPSLCFAEIAPMTKERTAEAVTAGRKASTVDEIVHSEICRTRKSYTVHVFDVSVTTPFAVTAHMAFEARKSGARIDFEALPVEPPDKQTVIVTADPAARSSAPPATVATVLLRRGKEIIRALRADFHDVHFPQADAWHRTYRGGAFYFPLDAFASARGDLEIVVIPAGGGPGEEALLKLKRADLEKLR